jgi:hypothetical protein
MATLFRIDPAPLHYSDETPRHQGTSPQQRLPAGVDGDSTPNARVRLFSQVTPLDERLQPCGAAFVSEVERRSADTVWLSHTRPVRAPYLAVDVALDEVRQQRLILRITHCQSYGLDYNIRGDVMGS